MAEHFDVVVVGAGLIGAAFALDVARKTELKIALLERAPALEETADNQRVVALGKAATSLLVDLEILAPLVPHHAHAYNSMLVWDENSSGELYFRASDLDRSELGYMVDAQACTRALQAKAQSNDLANLSCYFETQFDQLKLSRRGAELIGSQGHWRANLVVGADGARSWVRQQAKIFSNKHAYRQCGIVAKVRTSESHNDCAWQRFLTTGPVAVLPLHDNFSSIVWSADLPLADELMAMNDGEFRVALAQALEQRLGDVIEVGARQAFPLISQQAESYISQSLALVGDAAHSIHPLAGQGANLGFKDLRCLTDMLAQAGSDKLGEPDFLAAYQRKRQPDNLQSDWLMSALNAGFRSDSPWWLSLRGAGMKWLNSSQRIKELLAQQAMGIDHRK